MKKAIGSNIETVLDIGCGDGELMSLLADGEGWKIYGLELYENAIKKAKKRNIYAEIVNTDVTNISNVSNLKKFDVVFASQVIEHLKRNDALKSLKEWEKLAKKRVVVSTPIGFIKYDLLEERNDSNPYQKHLSGWNIKELREMGYKVIGQGARFIYGPNGVARRYPKYLIVFRILAYIISPFIYFNPNLGTYMIAVKEK